MPFKLNRSFAVTVVFGLLGILVNLPQITVFNGARLLFGGVFYLVIALTYGPLYGAVAALISAVPSMVLWGHPETACILVAEALTVGWLARRRFYPVVADLIYWAVIGTPLAALFYLVLYSYPAPYGWVMVVKHPANGLLNVMIAELLISIPALQKLWGAAERQPERRTLRNYLSHGFLLVATVPLLVLNIVNGENYAERRESEAGQRLQEAAKAIREDLEDHVTLHELAVRELSRSITTQGRFDLDALNGWLRQTRQVYNDFQSITIGNADGFPIAVDPEEVPGLGKVLSNKPGDVVPDSATMRDREYFKRVKGSRQSVISEVFVSRVFRQPTVAVAAPIFTPGGELFGVIAGMLDLSTFRQLTRTFGELDEAGIFILDQQDRVIYSNRGAAYRPLESMAGVAAGEGSPRGRRGVSGGPRRRAAAQCQVSGEPDQERSHGLERFHRAATFAAPSADRALLLNDGGMAGGRDPAVAAAFARGGFKRDVAAGAIGESRAGVFGSGGLAGAHRAARASSGRSGGTGEGFRRHVGAAAGILHGAARGADGSRALEW
jgi:hypothetical protein